MRLALGRRATTSLLLARLLAAFPGRNAASIRKRWLQLAPRHALTSPDALPTRVGGAGAGDAKERDELVSALERGGGGGGGRSGARSGSGRPKPASKGWAAWAAVADGAPVGDTPQV